MGLPLLEAIKQKYCPSDEVGIDWNTLPLRKPVKETATIYRPGGRPLHQLTLVVLDNAGITRVIHCKELSELCPNILELHLGANQITSWNSVISLFNAFPKLKFLDLSQNLLTTKSSSVGEELQCGVTTHPNLTTLVLNSTMITWDMLKKLLLLLPSLQELHLSLNSPDIVPSLVVDKFPAIKQLYINKCGLSRWEDFCRLSDVFPCLEQLIADSNPLQKIAAAPPYSSDKLLHNSVNDETRGETVTKRCNDKEKDGTINCQFKNIALTAASNSVPFSYLKYLNINNCELLSWEDIDALGELPSLNEASLLNIPIGDTLDDKECRMTYISRLQRLHKLNKSSISDEERESAERWFIRLHLDDPNPPHIYSTLEKRHGKLLPLAEVDLSARDTARLRFTFHNISSDQPAEEHEIDLDMTAQDLRSWIGKELLRVPPNTLSLYYIDKNQAADGYGPEMIRPTDRPLSKYRMADGDEIDVCCFSENDLYFRTYHTIANQWN